VSLYLASDANINAFVLYLLPINKNLFTVECLYLYLWLLNSNKKLKKYCKKQGDIGFADVWYPMLDKNGNLYKDVFIEDGLHMNKKGYDIWGKVIGGFLN
jgi:hypothetical protein